MTAMNTWSSKSLGDGMLALESLGRIRELFPSEYAKADRPNDMAVFIRHETEGRLHCEVRVYFSPAASSMARKIDAESCEKPSSSNLELLAGHEGAWSVLFPEDSGCADPA